MTPEAVDFLYPMVVPYTDRGLSLLPGLLPNHRAVLWLSLGGSLPEANVMGSRVIVIKYAGSTSGRT